MQKKELMRGETLRYNDMKLAQIQQAPMSQPQPSEDLSVRQILGSRIQVQGWSAKGPLLLLISLPNPSSSAVGDSSGWSQPLLVVLHHLLTIAVSSRSDMAACRVGRQTASRLVTQQPASPAASIFIRCHQPAHCRHGTMPLMDRFLFLMVGGDWRYLAACTLLGTGS